MVGMVGGTSPISCPQSARALPGSWGTIWHSGPKLVTSSRVHPDAVVPMDRWEEEAMGKIELWYKAGSE